MKISVFCVYNREKDFDEQLLSSLKTQNCDFELIPIYNVGNKYPSAAKAYNSTTKKVSGDIYIFSHQDVLLKESNSLEVFAKEIDNMPTGCIFGAVGAKETNKKNIGNYTSGDWENSQKLLRRISGRLLEVSCVDECFFGMKKETFDAYPFDEILCDGWDLYAVDMCMNARRNGSKVYVVPIEIHHFSHGTISASYMDCLRRMALKYKEFKYIWTTCYKVRTNYLYIHILVFLWKLKKKIL